MRRMTVLLTLMFASTVSAQTVETADKLNVEGHFEEAVSAYRAVLEIEPSSGAAWYGLGRALQSLQRYDDALAAFGRAGELGFQPGGALFRKGAIHLEKGQIDEAKRWLSAAAGKGVPVHNLAKEFPSFQSVKDDPEFQAYLDSLAPCSSSEHRQFDFWVGDWDVYTPEGRKAGENTITSALGGCVLLEQWQGMTGGAGMSFNRFDPGSGTWNQHWVFNNGSEMNLTGTFEQGRIVLETPDGVWPRQRWTWYEIEPGRVRQMAEQTTDGESWTTTWDSVYVPKGTPFETPESD